MKYLVILNDPPYGSERGYNGLRLAINLLRTYEELFLTLFLMGDAVICGKKGQTTPQGYYNIEKMLKAVTIKSPVLLCGTCMDARGITNEELAEGCLRSTLDELTRLAYEADKVIVF
ncbi:MAG: hypothetical protein Kow0090_17430 [Myxococcota bacterium]